VHRTFNSHVVNTTHQFLGEIANRSYGVSDCTYSYTHFAIVWSVCRLSVTFVHPT